MLKMVMKVREVVLDEGSDGTVVTMPANITWFPNQFAVLVWWVLTVVGLTVGAIWWRIEY